LAAESDFRGSITFEDVSRRLTLNVLLSFAQFEREVTGERIRDKIAASKKKGIWMGGVVPLGYRVDNRALHVAEEHAAFVRDLFRRYLETGSVVRLKAALDQENVRLPTRTDGRGKTTGGGLISRGHLYKILSNPIYIGRLTHKDQVHEGLHAPIVRSRELEPGPTPACRAYPRQSRLTPRL
jgi:site-specific DNA recombinase